jgi:tetratricopeptide (TPR) repeat protein
VSQSPAEALRLQRYEDGWEIINRLIREDYSWGGRERKCFHVACDDGTFADISAAAGVDYGEDGRAFCVMDLDRDGRPDLCLKNRTSPQVRILQNVWPGGGKSLWLLLEGARSNRDAIGARVTLRTAKGVRMKEVAAGSLFLSQSSRWLCFGLGDDPGEVRGEARWPGGGTQDLGVLEPGKRYRVREGEPPAAESFSRPAPFARWAHEAAPVSHSAAEVSHSTAPVSHSAAQGAAIAPGAMEPKNDPPPKSSGTWLLEPLPAPDFQLPEVSAAGSGQEEKHSLARFRGKPLFIHFLSLACPVCLSERDEMRRAEVDLQAAGASLCHILTDLSRPREEVRKFRQEMGFRAPLLQADGATLTAYDIVHRHLWNKRRSLTVPSIFLIDEAGAIVKACRGPVTASDLAADARRIPRSPGERIAAGLPWAGTACRFSLHRDLLGLGNAFFEARLPELARATFQAGSEKAPEDAELLFNYALASEESGRAEEAEAAYKKVLDLAPGLDDARNNLGAIFARAGRAAEARQLFLRVVERNPAHAEAVLNLGNTLLRDNQVAEAIKVYQAALKHDPESAPFHRQLGYAEYRAGDLGGGLQRYQRAVQLDPLDLEAKLGLSILLMASGQWKEAEAALEEGLRRAPRHPGLLNASGMAKAGLGKVKEAAAALEKAIASDPAQDRPYLNLARLHIEQGEKREARAVLERLLKLEPNHAVARELMARAREGE